MQRLSKGTDIFDLFTAFFVKIFQGKIHCKYVGKRRVLSPPQVKCRLLISSIFYVMNFRHFSEMP